MNQKLGYSALGAIAIVGGRPEGYPRSLQIQALEKSGASLIYVPTEAGLPVTEARRLGR